MKAKPWAGDGKRGLQIWCPGCDSAHSVQTKPSRWTWNGDVEKPTLSPSLLIRGAPHHPVCHCFVRDGRIEFLTDSTHALAGQTVDLPDWPYSD